jgi:hypothetical protein
VKLKAVRVEHDDKIYECLLQRETEEVASTIGTIFELPIPGTVGKVILCGYCHQAIISAGLGAECPVCASEVVEVEVEG